MIVWRAARMRWGQLAVATLLLAVVGGIVAQDTASIVHAHAALIRSSPQNGAEEQRPPARVILYFSEPVEPKLTKIEVFDIDRARVDENDTAVDGKDASIASVGVPTLDPGLYTVEFSNVSTVDGHPWSGIFQFIIKNPDGSIPPEAVFDPEANTEGGATGLLPQNIDIALKWAALLSLATAIGAAVFVVAVAKPAGRFLDEEDRGAVDRASDSWAITLAHILLPVSFIAAAMLVVVSVGRFQTDTSLFDYLTEVRTGRYQLANLILVAAALVGADIVYLSGKPGYRRFGFALLLGAGFAAMLTYSLTSHSAAGAGKFWSVSSDFIHLATSSLWVGALALLVPVMRQRKRLATEAAGFLYVANAFDRFSVLAGASVFAVMVTGVFNGLVEIPTWSALTDTTYGKVLLAKLIIVAVLLPIAGINAFFLKPRLVEAIDGLYQEGGKDSHDQRSGWSRSLAGLHVWLPRTIVAEITVVVAVFASVAVLTQTSTAKGEIAQREAQERASTEFTDVRDAGDLELTFEIRPNTVGINRYTLFVKNPDGSAPTTVTLARLRFSYTDPAQPDVRPPAAELVLREGIDPGEFVGQGSYFTQPGSWLVEATIRRSDADDVSRTFSVPVAPSELTREDEGGAFALPFESLQWNQVAGALIALAGLAALIYREQFRGSGRYSYRIVVTAGTAFILAGATLWFGVHTEETKPDPTAGNPVDATEESLARGKMLFQQNCVTCHGPEGRGDGPQAESLDPAPADIRQHLPYHTDAQFFTFISEGIAGTAMPAWGDTFSEEDIWNIQNYLRTFQDVAEE